MKKTYMQPEIWVEVLTVENPLLALSNEVTSTAGNSGIIYGGGGNGPARAGENSLWDDEDDGSDWDQL